MNKHTVFGAATLLLAVGAATTLADDMNRKLYDLYWDMFSHNPARFKLSDCNKMRNSLAEGNKFSTEPTKMLSQLNKLKTKDKLQRYFAARLISYAELDCGQIKADEFLAIVSIGNQVKDFEPFVKFVDHYGRQKFLSCSRKILKRFNKGQYELEGWSDTKVSLDEFFRLDLEISVSKSSEAIMYEHAKKMENSFELLEKSCTFCRDKVFHDVSIINVARIMGFVQERELAPHFPRLNKYVLFCVRYLNKEASTPVRTEL